MRKKGKHKKINIITYLITVILLICVSFCLRNFYLEHLTTTDNYSVDKALLKKAEEKLSDYDYIINFDTMKFVWVKPKTIKLFGYTVNEALKLKNTDFIHKDSDLGFIYSRIISRMEEKEGVFDAVTNTKDGANRKVNITYKTFLFDGKGYVVGRLNSCEEISDEEATECYSE